MMSMKKGKGFIVAATMSLGLTVGSAWAMPLPLGTDISDRFHGTVHRNDLIATDETYVLSLGRDPLCFSQH